MKKFFIMILLGCLCLPGVSQVANEAPALIGSWTGKLKAGTMSLTLVFNFSQADGYVVCTFDSPDQNAKGIGV